MDETVWSRRLVSGWVIPGVLLALVLTLVNVWYAQKGDALSRELVANQEKINEGLRLGRINAQVIRGIAGLSVETQDNGLRVLLARHGITFAGGETSPVNQANQSQP